MIISSLSLIVAKHGIKGVFFFKQEENLRAFIAKDSGLLVIIVGFFQSLVAMILMMDHLSDQAALGPIMVLSLQPILYGCLFYLFIFFPFTKLNCNER